MISCHQFIVTGGFRDEASPEGYIGKLELLRDGTKTSLVFNPIIVTPPPNKNLALANKGFTGGTIHNNQLWVCSANQVLCYTLHDWQLIDVIDNALFNDLHHVLADDSGLYVVNTGLEAIDYLKPDGTLIKRVLLTSDKRTDFRISQANDFRLYNSEPHFMHANHCTKNERGDLLVTFTRQRRVVNLGDWSWSSPEYEAPPHDGKMAYYPPHSQNYLWVTNVHSKIVACDNKHHIKKSWNLKDYYIPAGWVRGLAIMSYGMLVGISKITESNRNYYSGWHKQDFADSKTAIAYIPFDDKENSYFNVIFPERKAAKIFSIISHNNDGHADEK